MEDSSADLQSRATTEESPRPNRRRTSMLEQQLEDDCLGFLLEYLPGQFRYVAAVNRRFRMLYPHAPMTTYESAVLESIATVAIWLDDAASDAETHAAGFAAAIRKGDLNLLAWMCSQAQSKYGFTFCTYEGLVVAATCGNLEVLKWLRSQDPSCELDCALFRTAARNGRVEVVAWLRSQIQPPCRWDRPVCRAAAARGQLEVLQWMQSLDHPCHWPTRLCEIASRNGHLEVLQWLRSQDPPRPWIHAWCLQNAQFGPHPETIEWLQEQEP